MRRDKMLKITRKVSNRNIDCDKVNELVDYARGLNIRIAEFDKKSVAQYGIMKKCLPQSQIIVKGEKVGGGPKLKVKVEAVCQNEKAAAMPAENLEAVAVRRIAVR